MDENSQAVGARVDRGVRPRAWAVGASYWPTLVAVPYMLRSEAEPLFDADALDAERGRCIAYIREQAAECPETSPVRATLESCAGVLALRFEGPNVRVNLETTE